MRQALHFEPAENGGAIGTVKFNLFPDFNYFNFRAENGGAVLALADITRFLVEKQTNGGTSNIIDLTSTQLNNINLENNRQDFLTDQILKCVFEEDRLKDTNAQYSTKLQCKNGEKVTVKITVGGIAVPDWQGWADAEPIADQKFPPLTVKRVKVHTTPAIAAGVDVLLPGLPYGDIENLQYLRARIIPSAGAITRVKLVMPGNGNTIEKFDRTTLGNEAELTDAGFTVVAANGFVMNPSANGDLNYFDMKGLTKDDGKVKLLISNAAAASYTVILESLGTDK
jgi:hypothetical protein